MSEWKEYKFSDFVELIKDIYSPNVYDEINYIGLEHIEQETLRLNSVGKSKDVTSNKFQFKKNDVLFGKLRVYFRKVVKPKFDGICSTDIWVLRAKEGFDQDFLFYFVANWDFINLADSGEGGTRMPRADWNFLKNTVWNVPELPEQKTIASILSSLDDKIDLLNRQNATLEKMAETLFRQWFVEEDNDDTISQLISIQNGYAFKSKDFRENGIHGVIKIKNISDGIIDIEKTDFIENEIAKSAQERFKIRTGDILIAMTGAEIGKLGIIPKTNKNLWLNQRVGLLKEKFRGSKYLAYLQLKSEFGHDYIENTATGSAQPNISGTGIENCGFPKLSEKQIKEYSYQIGELFEKVIFNLGQIKTLTELRDMLLPKLMSGEIRVESHWDETSVETNNDTATLSPVGAASKTIKHG